MIVVVTVNPGQYEDVVSRLEAAGMKVQSKHQKLGLVSGEADDLDSLRAVEGVRHVRESRTLRPTS